MKQTNPEVLEKSRTLLKALKAKRGGSLVDFHKKIANDPALLQAFGQQYDICNKELQHLPRKYRELIILALGCAFKTPTTITPVSSKTMATHATVYQPGRRAKMSASVARM